MASDFTAVLKSTSLALDRPIFVTVYSYWPGGVDVSDYTTENRLVDS